MIRVLTAAQLAATTASEPSIDSAEAAGHGTPAELDCDLAVTPHGPRR